VGGPELLCRRAGAAMKDLSNSGWAAIFIFMAAVIAIVALFSHSPNATSVITIASSIITGAFGYIQGVSTGKNSLQVPLNPDSPSPTFSVTQQAPTSPK
jgi:hypothetical protein